jgi:hypothetical protein
VGPHELRSTPKDALKLRMALVQRLAAMTTLSSRRSWALLLYIILNRCIIRTKVDAGGIRERAKRDVK